MRGIRTKGAFGRGFWSDASGSLSVEASMVFPVVLLLTMVLVLYALYTAKLVLVHYGTAVLAERAAYNWPNSAAEWRTGAYPAGRHDGLYWRLAEDALLQALFPAGGESRDAEEPFPPDGPPADGAQGLVTRKLRRAAETAPEWLKGTVGWKNRLLIRSVVAEASDPAAALPLRRFWNGVPEARASVSALAVEPAEFVRSFELARYYTAKFKRQGERAESYRREAGEVLRRRGG
ncbi:MAG: hypothetical protein BAA02_07285 [Paenibacillaceae bacterium ZCTH02-B3]|nr:MAG: hypothetical protein BAA02_07285 [Paenibacillaceae bacterium ZCTH02-B3]